jgi:hypothetical protein
MRRSGWLGRQVSNLRIRSLLWVLGCGYFQPLLVEREGFETTRPEAVDGVTKSRTIPLKLVQRVWRKIPFSKPFLGLPDRTLEFSRAKTSAKQRDFEGDCASKAMGAQVDWRSKRDSNCRYDLSLRAGQRSDGGGSSALPSCRKEPSRVPGQSWQDCQRPRADPCAIMRRNAPA